MKQLQNIFCRGQMEDECHKLARPLRCKCFGSQNTFAFNSEKAKERSKSKILKDSGTQGSQVANGKWLLSNNQNCQLTNSKLIFRFVLSRIWRFWHLNTSGIVISNLLNGSDRKPLMVYWHITMNRNSILGDHKRERDNIRWYSLFFSIFA